MSTTNHERKEVATTTTPRGVPPVDNRSTWTRNDRDFDLTVGDCVRCSATDPRPSGIEPPERASIRRSFIGDP